MSEHEEVHSLSPEDARLLDALVESGFDPARLSDLDESERRRVDALHSVFALMEDYPVEDADETLVSATLLRVRRTAELADREQRVAGLSTVEATPTGWRIRMPDLISVAAIILIAAAVSWPVIGAVRQKAVDMGCQNNLRTLAQGFEMYARDHAGRIPTAPAGYGASLGVWADPFVLSQHSYCEHGHANCPGHHTGGGYSRQVFDPNVQVAWLVLPAVPILGDRNPVIDARATGDAINPFLANSENHSQRGQNILKSDGTVEWLPEPVYENDDNIWLISGQRQFEPGNSPKNLQDAFLAH